MINFGDDKIFIENYKRLKSSRKMGELYHCDKKSITTHAKKIGYDFSKNKEVKIANIPIETIIQEYEELGSTRAVGELHGCSSTTVARYLKANGYALQSPKAKLADVSNDDFIKAYDELGSAEKVGKKFNCSDTAVLNHAKKIGYIKQRKLSEKDKQEILNCYNINTSTELAKRYNISRGMITKFWHDNGLLGKIVENPKTKAIDLTGQTFGYWTVLRKTDNRSASGGIMWKCRCNCGVEREVSSLSLRNGTSLSCGNHSNVSKGNDKIKKILQNANIPFETEVKFPSCADKKPMPFDFFVDKHYLIEYDGIQHFEDTIFDYEYTHKHDLMKNQWCLDNNILLIRIPYTHYNDLCLEDLLPETSKFIEIMPTLN